MFSWRFVWNCRTTEIEYNYKFAGPTYGVIDSNPFLFESSAKAEVERFTPGKSAVVRGSSKTATKISYKLGGSSKLNRWHNIAIALIDQPEVTRDVFENCLLETNPSGAIQL